VALIIGVDRILDMVRTMVNVTGDATVATIVAHQEGQLDEAVYLDPDADHEADQTAACRRRCVMSLKVRVVPVTPYQQNCSIIQCEQTGLAAIVDPGGDIELIEAAVSEMGATVEKDSTDPRAPRSLCGGGCLAKKIIRADGRSGGRRSVLDR
jgi:hypothetical protein